MKRIQKNWTAALICIALGSTLSACGHKDKVQIQEQTESEPAAETSEIVIDTPKETAATAAADSEDGGYRKIENQTFEATLNPLGKVTFVSYEPDSRQSSLKDAFFEIHKDGQTVVTLEGMYEDNVRANESFNSVEAVSFPDYNSDGYSDIIILCSYSPVSGREAGTGYSEARIYSGSENGSFTLERSLSEAANSAVAEKTVQTILGFLGAGKKEPETAGWKQAYIDYLRQDTTHWRGYDLIYVNDDTIPELVEIGDSEAAGCGIVTYADGAVDEVQLSRLNFTYIERGNLLCNSEGIMDHYYDLVYSIIDGRLSQTAAGYYGIKDSSDMELDENGFAVFHYHYEWNGSVVTEDEYNQALAAVYDSAQAKPGYDWNNFYTKEEVIKAIRDIKQ